MISSARNSTGRVLWKLKKSERDCGNQADASSYSRDRLPIFTGDRIPMLSSRGQARNRDPFLAAFTDAVTAVFQPIQGTINLPEFARFEFGKLRGHLFAAGLEGLVGAIARVTGAMQ